MRRWLVVLLLVGCSSTSGDAGDASAELACSDFQRLTADVHLMTPIEQRSAVQGLYDHARYSETPGIADAGRDMLETITSGDMGGFEDAVRRMNALCS